MKVCFILPYAYSLFDPKTNYVFGGSEVRGYLLGKGLSGLDGFEVSFAVFDHGQPSCERFGKINVYADKYFGRQGIDSSKSIPWRIGNRLKKIFYLAIGRFFNKRIKIGNHHVHLSKFATYKKIDADIYCSFGVGSFTAELVAFTESIGRKFMLFIGSGSDLSESYINRPDGYNEYGSRNDLCHYALNNADYIITQTQEQKSLLKQRFGIDSICIANPVDLSFTDEITNQNNEKHILWIGKSNRIKRPEKFVSLAKKFNNTKFIMIMNRSDNEIHETIKSECPANLMLYEYVSYFEIEKYFAGAAALVNTSIFEGFPNTFLQAGKYGVPVLSLAVDPEGFILNHETGFCANGRFDSLCEILKNLLQNDDIRSRWSQNIREYVYRKHNLDGRVNELSIFLKGCLI